MCRYTISNKAVEDLAKIWNYTLVTWSERQADIYYETLIETCSEIAKNPSLGKNYNEISETLYGFRINRHIIFYKIILCHEIEIVRILHGSMDLENRIYE